MTPFFILGNYGLSVGLHTGKEIRPYEDLRKKVGMEHPNIIGVFRVFKGESILPRQRADSPRNLL
jgi:hypothetical protein